MITRKNRYGLRLLGIFFLFLGFFILSISFLEKFSFISPDHNIISLEAYYAITTLRFISILLSVILLFFPEYLIHLLKKIMNFFNLKKRKNTFLFYLFIFLLFLLLVDTSLIFSGDVLFTEKNSLPAKGDLNIFLNIFKTALNFLNSFTTLLFTGDISLESIDLPIYKLYIREHNIDTLNENLPESGNKYVPGSLVFDNKTYNVKVRYRGDSRLHWYFPKKSLNRCRLVRWI